MPVIQPRTLKGFRDFPPALAVVRERMVDVAKAVYRSYGFAPIDTPALELAEILLGKLDPGAEIARQLYRFVDNGGRDVALRFDLTVPFARFAAMHVQQLGTPFKRSHVGTVWRGENTQAGRYREFLQCDFDTIGTTSPAADIEVALVIHDLLVALGFERFTVRVSDRHVLGGVLEVLGVADRTVGVLRAIDKLSKQGPDAVGDELIDKVGLSSGQAADVLEVAGNDLDAVAQRFGSSERVAGGVARLVELLAVAAAAGVPEGRLAVDLSISRGLDYYTGTVYETFLDDLPAIGSVCSGGRYDDLAGLYTSQALPGVGASLGLDRLLAAMEELGMVGDEATGAPVLFVRFPDVALADLHDLAAQVRRAGVGAEVYPDLRKVGAQLQHAERRGARVAVLAGPAELAQGVVKVKDLAGRTEATVPRDGLVAEVRRVVHG
ncbi:MAG: histidine--tRNA ligase [Acidimicrobiales bacterium]